MRCQVILMLLMINGASSFGRRKSCFHLECKKSARIQFQSSSTEKRSQQARSLAHSLKYYKVLKASPISLL